MSADLCQESSSSNGNTKHSSLSKTPIAKHWFFTFNNFTEPDILLMCQVFDNICYEYRFQEKIGDKGTKHLQGSISLKKKSRWSSFHLPKQIHWEVTRNKKASYDYVTKLATSTGRYWEKKKSELYTIKEEELYPFQKFIVDVYNSPVGKDIIWIYDKVGQNGKTELIKYMIKNKYKVIIATNGRTQDLACILAQEQEENNFDLNNKFMFILNVPKDVSSISYSGLEQIQDGLITSSKYKSRTLVFNRPHVVVMSNELPKENAFTERIKIYELVNKQLNEYKP